MTVGMAEPREFWSPSLNRHMGWQPWQMSRLRVNEYDRAVSYVQKVM